MSPTVGLAAARLRQLIYYNLDNNLVENAHFLAGRLYTLDPRNGDSAHLLALTTLRLRRFQTAYDYSHKQGANGRHLGCAYVFAQACLELGRAVEGIRALDNARAHWSGKSDWDQHSETSRRHLPDAPSVLTLKAKLWTAHGDMRRAGDCYVEVHKLNPFIWDAFEGLCKIGADLKVENMFQLQTQVPEAAESDISSTQIYVDEDSRLPLAPHASLGQQKAFSGIADPFGPSQMNNKKSWWHVRGAGEPEPVESLRTSATEWDTPTNNTGDIDEDIAMGGVQLESDDVFGEPPAAPSRRIRPGEQFEASDRVRQPALSGTAQQMPEGAPDGTLAAPRKPSFGGQKRTISGQIPPPNTDVASQPRRSNRLFTQTTSTRSTRTAVETVPPMPGRQDPTSRVAKTATGTKGRLGVVGRVVSGNRKVLPLGEQDKEKRATSRTSNRSATIPSVPSVTAAVIPKEHPALHRVDHLAEHQAMKSLLDNFRHLAVGSYALSRFNLPLATRTFEEALGADTPWVLAQMGKAHYEAGDYKRAEWCFGRLLKVQPSRVEDMDMYSTVLWHLKKEAPLSLLCHLLRDQAFDAPQTWVAVGNAFSLSREHDQAITAFRRATQLDDKFAYAYTLMGHEYIANEAYDAALSAFRKSVAIDRRSYGGWYGLGKTLDRMGKLEDAEKHYRIAASINPSNSTLLVCIGVILERMRKKEAALANYAKALELQPNSQLARFKKARVLMHLKYFDQALIELEALKDQAPEEPNVWFLLGKCYKGLDRKSEGLRALTAALNLDPKASPFIKDAMEAIDEEDDSDGDGD